MRRKTMKTIQRICYVAITINIIICLIACIPHDMTFKTCQSTFIPLHTFTTLKTQIRNSVDISICRAEAEREAKQEEVESSIDDEYDRNVDILAHLINAEAGATYCSTKMRYYVGSVVLNRVASDRFPNTLDAVVHQQGQYQCTWNGMYYRQPSEECYRIAEELLTGGSVLPEYVVFQANFVQGNIYCQEQNMYFCY